MKHIRLFIFASLLATLPAMYGFTRNGQDVEGRASANRAFVTNFGGDGVSVIDLENTRLVTHIKTGSLPHGVAIAPDGKAVYVSNEGDGTLTVIDSVRNAAVATIAVGRKPNQL
jgi:YVTN family beta-propeller protein